MASDGGISADKLESFSAEFSDNYVLTWFSHRLNRRPVSADIYTVSMILLTRKPVESVNSHFTSTGSKRFL